MARFKNVSPLGDLEVPELDYRTVKAGEVIEIPDDRVGGFAGQASWEPSNKATRELVHEVLAERVATAAFEPAAPTLQADSFAVNDQGDPPTPPVVPDPSFAVTDTSDPIVPPAPAVADFSNLEQQGDPS